MAIDYEDEAIAASAAAAGVSKAEIKRREKATYEDSEKYVRGEMTIEEVMARAIRRYEGDHQDG